VVTILERLAAGLEGVLLRTEIYSIHGFSHVFFGIGLASIFCSSDQDRLQEW